jgi:hypothetical protein
MRGLAWALFLLLAGAFIHWTGGWTVVMAVAGTFLLLAVVARALVHRAAARMDSTPLPATLTLAPVPGVAWQDDQAGADAEGSLRGLGFLPVGCFGVVEMAGVELEAWCHPGECAYAVVYSHPAAGVWVDVTCAYQEGGRLTVTNTGKAGNLDLPDGWTTTSFPGATAEQLWGRFCLERRPVPCLPATPEGFVDRFVSAYAQEMAWRNNRGGPTAEEIRRVAQAAGMEVTDAQVAVAQSLEAERARRAREGG